MFLSESIVRAIHADRVRDIERTARERRMLIAADEATEAPDADQPGFGRPVARSQRPRPGRTGLPA